MVEPAVQLDDAALETGPQGRPSALRWHSHLYRVTDSPTRLEDAMGALLTHPLPVRGWRFQGTDADRDDTLVFDVLACGDGWRVLRTYR